MKALKDDFHLMPDQMVNAKALVQKKRALLVDSTGSGKTPVVLYSFAYLFSKGFVDALIVFTPLNAHKKRVWKPQIEKFTNFRCISFEEIESQVNKGCQLSNILRGFQIIYAKHTSFKNNYPLCVSLLDHFKRPLALVDEVHQFRSTRSLLSAKASMALTHTFALWGITATDLSKNTLDTYNIINFVKPGKLGSTQEFISRFCATREKVIGRNPDNTLRKVKEVVGFKNISDFKNYLVDMLVVGSRSVEVNLHELEYALSERERTLYSKIAKGFCLDSDLSDEDWIRKMLTRDSSNEGVVRSIKSVERHSSRYIYLQSVVDGSLNDDGTFGLNPSSKSQVLLELVEKIVARGESALIYFDYYSSLDNIMYLLKVSGIKNQKGIPVRLIETSGRKQQKEGFITKAMCDQASYCVLCSRAASESENYPFINNVILYDIPTTPVTYLQFIGRITRRNTLFPGNLHVYLILSDNIDRYKMMVIGNKLYQMQATSYDFSGAFPQEYMQDADDASRLDWAKRLLLWKGRS